MSVDCNGEERAVPIWRNAGRPLSVSRLVSPRPHLYFAPLETASFLCGTRSGSDPPSAAVCRAGRGGALEGTDGGAARAAVTSGSRRVPRERIAAAL